MEVHMIFEAFAKAFERKIDYDYRIKLQYEITDIEKDNIWQINVENGKVTVYNSIVFIPEDIFILKYNTLLKLYNNELSPLTAYANEPDQDGNMTALIEPKVWDEQRVSKINQQIDQKTKDFFIRLHKFDEFFSKDYPGKIVIKPDHCRKLHNVNAIGLLSDFESGTLHAYFSIQKGDILTEPPVEFSVFVLCGKGTLRFGNEFYLIEKNEYYHIKPKDNVYISNENDELLDILYLVF